jgi:hypothetical protein
VSEGEDEDKFRFEPADHSYWIGKRRLVSVSEALKAGGLADYSRVPPAVLEWAAERGRAVHAATHFLDDGDLDVETLDDVIMPYVEAWRGFKAATKLEVFLREVPGFNEELGYAGTPDCMAKINGRWWLIDIKTYAPNETTGVQLAAYARLNYMPTVVEMRRAGVWLKPNGKYFLTEYYGKDDWQRFLICLEKAKKTHKG